MVGEFAQLQGKLLIFIYVGFIYPEFSNSKNISVATKKSLEMS